MFCSMWYSVSGVSRMVLRYTQVFILLRGLWVYFDQCEKNHPPAHQPLCSEHHLRGAHYQAPRLLAIRCFWCQPVSVWESWLPMTPRLGEMVTLTHWPVDSVSQQYQPWAALWGRRTPCSPQPQASAKGLLSWMRHLVTLDSATFNQKRI